MDTLTSRLLSSTNFWSMWKMVHTACMWSEMSHKSCFISSVVVAERDELLFFSSHSHVYLSVICALEQRLLMPCLWYMTHHTEQLFIPWINPEREVKKMQTCLPSARGLTQCSFVLPLPPLFFLLTWSFPPSSVQSGGFPPLSRWYCADTEQRASWVAKFGGKLFIWPLHVSAFHNLVHVNPVSSP